MLLVELSLMLFCGKKMVSSPAFVHHLFSMKFVVFF